MIKLPRIPSSGNSIEALKWFALMLMTGDHINKYLLGKTMPLLFNAGRLAMPIFVFVLAFNMSRSGPEARLRALRRMMVFGFFAFPGYVALGHTHLLAGWLPLNIIFTLFILVLSIDLVERGQVLAATSAVVIGGAFVEFWWPAIIFGLACYFYCQKPSWKAAFVALLSCLLLCLINGNLWVFASIPLILVVSRLNLFGVLPRMKWFFYSYYPTHLAVIWLLQKSAAK